MKKLIYITTIILTYSLSVVGQEIPIPENYSIIDTVYGNLDKDNLKELVVAYDIEPKKEFEGVPRELVIYKLKNGRWTEWKKSNQALYGREDGGMMGDPFGKVEIKDGILLINQNGGSSWKWGFTDKYRFQNEDFYLIGYTSISGRPCEYWKEVDFNLSTGKVNVKKEYEDCETEEQKIYKRENETLIEKGLKITLQNRQEKEIKIVTPKFGHEIYISIGK